MAWALRGGTPANNGGSASPLTIVLGAQVSVGDRIIVVIDFNRAVDPPSISSVTDNLGNVYSQDLVGSNTIDVLNNVQFRHWVYSAPVTVGGTPTISAAGVFGNGTIVAAAYSGLDQSATPVDVSVAAGAYPGNASPTSGATAVTGAVSELIIGAFSNDGQNKTFTAGAGFTVRASGVGGGTNGDIAIEDKDSGLSLAAQTADGTLNASSTWNMSCVVYKLSISVVVTEIQPDVGMALSSKPVSGSAKEGF